MAIVVGSTVGNPTSASLLEPILGLCTSYQYVRAAATAAERHKRIATLASFFAASGSAVTTDSSTSAAAGALVASKISYMKAILARGGSTCISNIQRIPSSQHFAIILDSVRTPVNSIHQYRIQFAENSKIVVGNIFEEHTARRHGCSHKLKTIRPGYLVPIASTQISTAALVGWTTFGVGIIGLTALSSLCYF